MNIIIVGCGKIGTALAKNLCGENHDVTVIDTNRKSIEMVVNSYDAAGYEGNGASASVLMKAGIKRARLLIAMTGNDEVNILCCMMARKLAKCKTIARVENPDYQGELSLIKEELGLAMVVNPDAQVAQEIARIIRKPFVESIDTFASGRAELLTYRIEAGDKLEGQSLASISKSVKMRFLICAIEHEGEVLIPRGDFVLTEGDLISCIVSGNNETEFASKLKLRRKKVSKCIIPCIQ